MASIQYLASASSLPVGVVFRVPLIQNVSNGFLTMTVTQSPAARLWLRETQDSNGTQVSALAQIDGSEYRIDPARGKCSSGVAAQTNPVLLDLEPALALPHVHGAEPVAGYETVSGVPSAHYRFDGRAVPFGPGIKVVGDLWVAADGRVLRYELRAEGPVGPDTTGARTWQYGFTTLHAAFAVEPPADCPPGRTGAPLTSDASAIVERPGYLHWRRKTTTAHRHPGGVASG